MNTQICIIVGESRDILFLKPKSLRKTKKKQGHSHLVLSFALASDERIMVSGSDDKSIIVWDLIESKKISQLKGHYGPINSQALTLDDQLIVSGSDDGTVRVGI